MKHFCYSILECLLEFLDLCTAQSINTDGLNQTGSLKDCTALEIDNGVVVNEWVQWWNVKGLKTALWKLNEIKKKKAVIIIKNEFGDPDLEMSIGIQCQ